jgi:hypothetical protein
MESDPAGVFGLAASKQRRTILLDRQTKAFHGFPCCRRGRAAVIASAGRGSSTVGPADISRLLGDRHHPVPNAGQRRYFIVFLTGAGMSWRDFIKVVLLAEVNE